MHQLVPSLLANCIVYEAELLEVMLSAQGKQKACLLSFHGLLAVNHAWRWDGRSMWAAF